VSPALGFAAAVVVLCVLAGLDRPIGDINSDQITYHLLGPVVWLREGRIRPLLEEALTAFPATVEVLFAVVRAIAGSRAPGVIGAVFFAAFLLQIRGLARRVGASSSGADLAAALFAGLPAITATIDSCFVDLPYAAFVLAAVRLALDRGPGIRFAVAGVFAGFAAGTKYFGLPTICLLALLVPFSASGTWWEKAWNTGVLVTLAAVVGGSWYLRNWIVLGNPIYPPPPLAWRLLPTPNFPLAAAENLAAYIHVRGAGLGKGFEDLLLLPFRLTYRTAWFHGGGGLGVALLAFAPIGIVLARRSRFAVLCMILACALTVFWFYSDQELRFLDAALGIFAVFAGIGGSALLRLPGTTRWLATAVLAISLGLGAILTVTTRTDRLRALLSPSAAEARYRSGVPHFETFAFLNSRPEVQKIFIAHPDVPAYYLQKSYTVRRGRYGEVPHPDINEERDLPRELGCTHILDVDYYGRGFRIQATESLRLVHSDKNARVYEVAPSP
jgi:hypothetical protein